MISAFIPTYNEEKNIRCCIQGLKKYPEITEIIVVDDNSTDKTVEIAESLGAKVIVKDPSLPKMKSESMNVAAQHATNDIMFVTDADVYAIDLSDAIDIAQQGADLVGIPCSIREDDRLISKLENHEYDIALKRIRPWIHRNTGYYNPSGAGFFIRTQRVLDNPIPSHIRGEDLYYGAIAWQQKWDVQVSTSEVRTYPIPSAKALLVQRARWNGGYFEIVKETKCKFLVLDAIPVAYRAAALALAIAAGTLVENNVSIVAAIVLGAYFGYEFLRSKSIKRSLQMMVYRQVNFLAFLAIPFFNGWTVNR